MNMCGENFAGSAQFDFPTEFCFSQLISIKDLCEYNREIYYYSYISRLLFEVRFIKLFMREATPIDYFVCPYVSVKYDI